MGFLCSKIDFSVRVKSLYVYFYAPKIFINYYLGQRLIHKRLQHIFGEQVFGLAPTEIIYRIATNYILWFDNRGIITKHNFKEADALQFSKDGTLPQMLEELFGDTVEKC